MITWDDAKRQQVIRDHGVDFDKIMDVFDDPFGIYYEDFGHSHENDRRFIVVGLTNYYGLVFAVYVYLDENDIHFITARRAENWMVNEYERNRK